MSARSKSAKSFKAPTRVVSAEIFKQVYDSPHSLSGKEKWITSDQDMRTIEHLLGMPPKAIGAPVWVSGDTRHCPKCRREANWLDIISSALAQVHAKELFVRVILGDKKFVNTEAPRAIADLFCFKCKTPIRDLRSFKCHNWAYGKPQLLEVLERMNSKSR